MVISLKCKGHQFFKGIKPMDAAKRKNVFSYTPKVGGVKTKSRTNPYPQKKHDPACVLQRLAHHPPLENHLS